jgi:hypothetical protein
VGRVTFLPTGTILPVCTDRGLGLKSETIYRRIIMWLLLEVRVTGHFSRFTIGYGRVRVREMVVIMNRVMVTSDGRFLLTLYYGPDPFLDLYVILMGRDRATGVVHPSIIT